MKYSAVITHWAQNDFRSSVMRESIKSLIETVPGETEIIVADNGGSLSDSIFLLNLTEEKKIACYIRNRNNMSFGFARNQALANASGDYLAVADNDIQYQAGWLEECVKFLEDHPDRTILSTPLAIDPMHRNRHYEVGELDGWKLNTMAGSNCWVMRKQDWEKIGKFDQHPIAGTKWGQRYSKMGYCVAAMPEPKAKDMGFRQGYNFREPITNKDL